MSYHDNYSFPHIRCLVRETKLKEKCQNWHSENLMRNASVKRHMIAGEERWVLTRWDDAGKRHRKLFSSKAAAQAEVDRMRAQPNKLDKEWSKLTESQKEQLLLGASPKAGKTFGDLLKDLLAAKQSAGRDPGYLKSLSIVLKGFIRGREEADIGGATLSDVELFLNSKRLQYRATLRARLSTLFNFAVRRGHLAANPCARLEPITLHQPAPKIFTPMQVARCLAWLRRNPRGMGWFVLSTFYGLRPEEAMQTVKGNINRQSGIVVVDQQTTKVRQRRVVECPHPKALELLNLALDLKCELPIRGQPIKRMRHRLMAVLKWTEWPKDITRHTAASYWLALKPNADYVAEQLGNSPRVLKRNYKALVLPQAAQKFWGRAQKDLPAGQSELTHSATPPPRRGA